MTALRVPAWREQYERVRRWNARLSESARPGEGEEEYEMRFADSIHAFFTTCHQLREWIRNDDDVVASDTKKRSKQLADKSRWLRRCANIADGSKHLRLKRDGGVWKVTLATRALGKEDGGGNILLETCDAVLLEGVHADVSTKEGTWDAREAASACIAEWDRILREIGLLHEGPA